MKALFPYAAISHGCTVRVSVNFHQEHSDARAGRWFWAYHIRIENDGERTIQLISRRWEIIDGRGMIQIVEGEGVVGDQPVIEPGDSFDYVSGCPLSTPSGTMEGSYRMIDDTGKQFFIAIPKFALIASPVSVQ